MNVRLLLAGIAALAMSVSGCAGMTDVIEKREALYQAAPLNPPKAHPAADAYRKALATAQSAYTAHLGSAQASASPAELIDAGIVAANSNCRAWLGAVSAAEQRWRQGETNVSVLMSLITGILAAANVHNDVILAYGLGSAAYAGYSQGFVSNVLAMSDYDIQTKVREAMAERARALRTSQTAMTFPQAYDAIEEYQSICTPQSAKALARSAMTAVTTTVAPAGTITVAPAPVPPAVAAAAAAVASSAYLKDDSGDRILAYWTPTGQVDQPNQARLNAWMGEKGIFASIPFFAHSKLYELARKQLVADLNLPAVQQ